MVDLGVTLIFDGDCKFCSSSARTFSSMTRGRISTVPYQRADLASFGLTLEQCEQAVQYVSKGEIYSGHLAIAQGLIDSKTSWSLAGYFLRWPVVTSVAYMVYHWVSANRHRLPGGTAACSLDGR
jgi:predicted DCC family thiol-disulfide oxidoreductase YuxK